eukprot:183031-Prymnesium_polylepis.1
MEMLFQNVPTLCHLDMTYGVKEIGMDYERSLFGMKMNDVTSLAKALKVPSRTRNPPRAPSDPRPQPSDE